MHEDVIHALMKAESMLIRLQSSYVGVRADDCLYDEVWSIINDVRHAKEKLEDGRLSDI